MDMGMRVTISKYQRGIGAIKCKDPPHTPRGQARGNSFYIGNKIRAKKKSTVCKKEIPFMVMEGSMIVMILSKEFTITFISRNVFGPITLEP